MPLELIQPLTEMSTRIFPEGYRRPVCRADKLELHVGVKPASEQIALKSGSHNLLEVLGTVQARIGFALPIPLLLCALHLHLN
jgi:hypothetical protein